jgi:hypothetical protein
MKKSLFLPMLLVTFFCIAQDVKNIIGKPTKIGNIEVAQYDFPNAMSLDAALKGSKALGNGWRLPSKDELNTLYQNKDKIGGFASLLYWSLTDYNQGSAWSQSFHSGSQGNYLKTYSFYIRVVRTFGTYNQVEPNIVKEEEVKEEDEIKEVEKLEDTKIRTFNQDETKNDGVVVPEDDVEDKIFTVVQIPAEFPGGQQGWIRYLERTLNRDLPVENGAPTGEYRVMVSFIVAKDGSISEVKAENDPGFGTKEEAVRVIQRGPKWKPAVQNGRYVIYRHRQAIAFIVSEDSILPKNILDMIGMPIKIGNIEVAQYDFPNQMNWVDAKKACESLGDGWRLPTKEELDKLYQYRNRIESFNTGNYWSSSESDFNNAYYLGFDNGGLDQVYKKYTGYVRAVRTF